MSTRSLRPRRACRDQPTITESPEQPQKHSITTKRPAKTRPAPKNPSPTKRRKVRQSEQYSSTDEPSEDDSGSVDLSSEDSDYNPAQGECKNPFAKMKAGRKTRKIVEPEDSSSEEMSADEKSSHLSDPESRESENEPQTDRPKRQKPKPKPPKKKPKTRKTAAKSKSGQISNNSSSSEDEWEDGDSEVNAQALSEDDRFNEIANLVQTTEKVSLRRKKAGRAKLVEDDEFEEVEIKIKEKKSKKKYEVMPFEDTVLMLLRREVNRNKKKARQHVHKVHILSSIHHGREFMKLTGDDQLVYGLLYSIACGWSADDLEEQFGEAFEIDILDDYTEKKSFYDITEDEIINQIASRKITDQWSLAVILKVLNNLVGRNIRIVHNMKIMTFKDGNEKYEEEHDKRLKKLLKTWKTKFFVNCWLETSDDKTETWKLHEFYENHESLNPKERIQPTPSYIFGFADTYVRDVTARYDPNWLTSTRKLRVASYDKDWWKSVLKTMEKNLDKREKNLEDRALQNMLMGNEMPKTISAFKSHPLYALERHLLKYEAFYPDDVEAIKDEKGEYRRIRDELVYPRSAVKSVTTPNAWLMKARQVREGEKPYKYVASWQQNKKLRLEPGSKNSPVYGLWQTETYKPPVIEDNGIIPRNRFGNIDLYQPQMCPINGRHITGCPGLIEAATSLKLDAVQAVVGWESGRQPIPKYDGWIIHEKTAKKLLAHYETVKAEIQADIDKAEAERLRKDADRRKYECKYCGKKLTAVKNRKVHIQLKHPGMKAY